jgi:hypothetical protein
MARWVGQRTGRCKTCNHSERARIDYLIATGAPLKPLAPVWVDAQLHLPSRKEARQR